MDSEVPSVELVVDLVSELPVVDEAVVAEVAAVPDVAGGVISMELAEACTEVASVVLRAVVWVVTSELSLTYVLIIYPGVPSTDILYQTVPAESFLLSMTAKVEPRFTEVIFVYEAPASLRTFTSSPVTVSFC